MTVEKIQLLLLLLRDLWEQLLGRAQAEQKDETTLMIRAMEQFLQQEVDRTAMAERLQHECEELAMMEFDDVGTEDEWLIIQNEALNKEEKRRQARSKALANIRRRRRILPDNMPDSVTVIRQIRSANE